MDRDDDLTQTIDAAAPDPQTIDRLLGGAHHDPHAVLGAHPHEDGTIVRVLRPHADEVHVVRVGGEGYPLVKVHDAGLFSGVVPGPPADYRLAVRYGDRVDIVDDPYRWLPTLGEIDLHLISEGRHERLWDVLGAHVRSYDTPSGTVTGTSFAVWAPTAQGVRVTGDFDGWTGWAHPMRVLGSTGIWELFVPGITPGVRYKYRILGADGRWRDKADPMAFRTEIPPATGSIVDVPTHEWADEQWMTTRAQSQAYAEPMSVYEVHLGSWRPGLGYREMAQQLVDYLDETGFTHVELLPVAEHPFGGSWGYQVTSYYAPTSRFGTPDDFRWFVDHLHQHGYGVIVDWVPAHFPRDEWALAKFDGTPLYEHSDPRRGEQPDWGTLVFDFGRKEVRNFLVANALYWLDQFHIDGLRVDAVASMLYLDYSRPEGQWLPNIHGGRENLDAVAFLQEMNATVYRYFPGVVTIAEESTAWPGVSRPTHLGGLGFGFKWNMGWMHDTLDYIGRDPIYRGYHHNQMTFSLMYAFSENFVLPLSHDEVVHGKGSLWERMPGDAWNKAANLRALLAYMWAHPGKQLLFQGGEFGQEREWSEQRSLDWHLLEDPLHGGIKTLVGDLNRAYRSMPAMWTRDVSPEGFSWIDANDSGGNVLSFLRHGVDAEGKPTVMACVANFSGNPKPDYRVGLPFAGRWREVLNTDAESYGGSGVGNLGGVDAEQVVWHGRPASAVLQLPPAGVLWLAPELFEGAVRRRSAVAAEPAAPAAPSEDGSAADIGEPGAEATAPVSEPAAESVAEPEDSVVDFGRPTPGSAGLDEPGDDTTVTAPTAFSQPSTNATPVAESTADGAALASDSTADLRQPSADAPAAESTADDAASASDSTTDHPLLSAVDDTQAADSTADLSRASATATPAAESTADLRQPSADAAPIAESAPQLSAVDDPAPTTLGDVAEPVGPVSESTGDEDTVHADESTASAPEPTVRIPAHAAPETADDSTVSIADLPSTAQADEDATTRTFAPTSPTAEAEPTTRIPHPLSDEATTRFSPPADDDTATPPNGIALLDDETLEAQSSPSSDRGAGQATGEVAGTAEAGSSDEPDDGSEDTAHRNSTAQ